MTWVDMWLVMIKRVSESSLWSIFCFWTSEQQQKSRDGNPKDFHLLAIHKSPNLYLISTFIIVKWSLLIIPSLRSSHRASCIAYNLKVERVRVRVTDISIPISQIRAKPWDLPAYILDPISVITIIPHPRKQTQHLFFTRGLNAESFALGTEQQVIIPPQPITHPPPFQRLAEIGSSTHSETCITNAKATFSSDKSSCLWFT